VSGISVSREQSEPVVSEENSVADTDALSAAEEVAAVDPLASGDGKRTAVGQPSQSRWVNVEPNFSPPKMTFKGTPSWLLPPRSLSLESCPLEFFQLFLSKVHCMEDDLPTSSGSLPSSC